MDDPGILALAQDMTIARAQFLRLLPAAVGFAPFKVEGDEISPLDRSLGWCIVVTPLPDLHLGAIALPRQRVEICLTGYDAARTRSFLERFELYYRRGGG